MDPLKNIYDVKVFIEGVEIPCDSVTISCSAGGISTLTVPLPSVGKFEIKPRSIVVAAIKDQSGVYRVQFQGETAAPSHYWNTSSTKTQIIAYSFDNHMDAIPIVLSSSMLETQLVSSSGNLDLMSKLGFGTNAMLQNPQELILRGGSLKFTVDPSNPGQNVKIESATNPGQTKSSSLQEIEKLITSIYLTNSYWHKQGSRTRMDSLERYFYYKKGIFENFQELHSTYISSMVGRYINSNQSFRQFYQMISKLMFNNYFINHSSFNKYMNIVSGFENVVPPTCNVVFPYQFNNIVGAGKSLSTPTRTIVTSSAVQNDTSVGVLSSLGPTVGYPSEIDDVLKSGDINALSNPITAEEKIRGVVGNILNLSSPLGAAAAQLYQGDQLLAFMRFYASYTHSKASNFSSTITVSCSYLPDIIAGLPVVFFKPLDAISKGDNRKFSTMAVLGYATSVVHIISKSNKTAQTSVTMNYVSTLGSGGYGRSLPLWMLQLSPSSFDGIYNDMLGCGAAASGEGGGIVSDVLNSASNFINDIKSSVTKSVNNTVEDIVGVGNILGSSDNIPSGSGFDVEQSVLNYINEIADRYHAFTNDEQRVIFANNVTNRGHATLEEILNIYGYEKSRAEDVNIYKQNLFTFSGVFLNKDTGKILGSQDAKPSSYNQIENSSGVTWGDFQDAAGRSNWVAFTNANQYSGNSINVGQYSSWGNDSYPKRQQDNLKTVEEYGANDKRRILLQGVTLTGYFVPPPGGYQSRSEALMEGGAKDAQGRYLRPLESYNPNDPSDYVSVAVDRRIIPLGSILEIEDYPGVKFLACDVGGAIKGGHIDICVLHKKNSYKVTKRNKKILIKGRGQR